MNALGYDLLRNGHPVSSLGPFRLNVIAFPDEAGVYDSYGEALALNGLLADPALAYLRSLALNSDDPHGQEVLRSVEARIAGGMRGGAPTAAATR